MLLEVVAAWDALLLRSVESLTNLCTGGVQVWPQRATAQRRKAARMRGGRGQRRGDGQQHANEHAAVKSDLRWLRCMSSLRCAVLLPPLRAS